MLPLFCHSDDEETPTLDVAARTSTSHTLVISEKPVEGEESSPPQQNVDTSTPSSPRAPSPKRARVEKIVDPAPQLGSSSPPLLDDPMIKDLLRIGSQFIGYREYANRAEEKLAEANERADALAQKLEQSEAARKKAELAASKAKVEADEAKAKAAGVEELQKKLEDATAALDEHKAAQASRDEGILKRLKSQSRRTLTQTNQDFDLDNPVNDPLLDALSLLEFHGREIREGVANANAGLSALFPYFFPKKEEPATFLNLAKMFNASEDTGLKMHLPAKDLEKLVRKISSLSKKDTVPSSCRVTPYNAANALPQPSMKEFIRLGTQFIGYRDYATKLEGILRSLDRA
ncbi:uncharacterized protein [Lolium perenne]|uniref:uncharacterized protein n=1 Tax=Lolium perenne TaxID=4522 RepID=UPI003A99F5FC